ESGLMSATPIAQTRPSSSCSLNCFVTSRTALAAASCAASFAMRVLRCTWIARYQSDATTPKELISCAVALIASQLIKYKRIEGEDRFNYGLPSGSEQRRLPVNFPAGALVGRDCVEPRSVYNACYRCSRRCLRALAHPFGT